MFSARRLAVAGLAGLAGLLCVVGHAQQVYRIVGPDGKVTFSDRPPPDAKSAAPAGGAGSVASSSPQLPPELRPVASKYPVTLYSAAECAPCTAGRTFLISRGIPYSERTISSSDDLDALKRLAGSARLPLLTIGGQQLRGYSEVEWGQFLDAAGYPKQSLLPASYRNPLPTPLVAVQAPTPATPGSTTAPVDATAASPQPAPSDSGPPNRAGIRF